MVGLVTPRVFFSRAVPPFPETIAVFAQSDEGVVHVGIEFVLEFIPEFSGPSPISRGALSQHPFRRPADSSRDD